jgi:hypothetical protein
VRSLLLQAAGHSHVYVRLDRPVPLAQYQTLQQGMRAYFNGDNKISDNDLLRPVGSVNCKAVVLDGLDEPSAVKPSISLTTGTSAAPSKKNQATAAPTPTGSWTRASGQACGFLRSGGRSSSDRILWNGSMSAPTRYPSHLPQEGRRKRGFLLGCDDRGSLIVDGPVPDAQRAEREEGAGDGPKGDRRVAVAEFPRDRAGYENQSQDHPGGKLVSHGSVPGERIGGQRARRDGDGGSSQRGFSWVHC